LIVFMFVPLVSASCLLLKAVQSADIKKPLVLPLAACPLV
jgi:hypothetical protein